MDLLFTRVVTASVLLWIAPNITKAGLIEMVKTPTAPCDGCYFAVFDKVKKEYRLKYITPNVPDMKEVVDKKQEVIWINAQGDYSPYWNVPENWGKEDDIIKSFSYLCKSSLIGNTNYECVSEFWINTAISDARYTLGISAALNIAALTLSGSYFHGVKINHDLVNKVKDVLDASDISSCGSSLTDKLFVNDAFKLTMQDFQSSNISKKYIYTKDKNNISTCFNAKDYIFAQGTSNEKYIFSLNDTKPSFIAKIGSSNEIELTKMVGSRTNNINCKLDQVTKFTYLDIPSNDFLYNENMKNNFIYRNNGVNNCINLENYRLQQKGLGQNKKTFLFSKSEPNKVTVFSGETVKDVDLDTLNNTELFDFNYGLDPNFLLDTLVNIGQQAFSSDKRIATLSNINSYITKEVQKFLTVPLVPEPSLPPTPTLVKGEFEKEAQFKERVLLEINKREAQVTALQARYRIQVEARNKEAERRIQLKDKYADFIAKRYFKKMMGGVRLQNPQYDSEKEIMYVDMVSTNSDFVHPLAIYIPLANDEAKKIKEQINEQSLEVNALFSVDKSTIVLNGVWGAMERRTDLRTFTGWAKWA